MERNGSVREPIRRPPRAERALRWVPSVLLACAGWAAFHEYGWVAAFALLAGAYVGRAAGDLAVARENRS